MNKTSEEFDIDRVIKALPHRYPFLLIDRVLECKKDEQISVLKNVTINEPFFQGHFPHYPIMPGVLILEAMAQACGVLSLETLEIDANEQGVFLFVGIDKARFKRPVRPGDQLVIKAKLARRMKAIWQFETEAYVDDELCCSAELLSTYRAKV